jgi:hypothetical protein
MSGNTGKTMTLRPFPQASLPGISMSARSSRRIGKHPGSKRGYRHPAATYSNVARAISRPRRANGRRLGKLPPVARPVYKKDARLARQAAAT